MEINGKIYRNLEGQVGYLTEKYGDLQNQIDDVRAHLTHYVIVEELPTEDIDTSAVYLVGPKGTEPDTYYEEWVYVQLEDESWAWEKLGDTASVDLSGYLQKVTATTTLPQVYVKNADGTQGMFDVGGSPATGKIPIYLTDGKVNVGTPTSDGQAANKGYVDTNFVAKHTGSTPYDQAYGKNTGGNPVMWNISPGADASTVALRDSAGKVLTKDPVNSSDAVNLSYANSNYVAKVNTVTTFRQSYAKNPDGSQYMQVINGKDMDAGVDRIACFGTDGRLRVGEPVNAKDAATKGYVDATVGQLMYLHDIDLAITIDSTNKLFVKGYLINGSSTAITTFDRIVYKQLDVQWGGFGPSSDNATPAAITKMPDSFRQDDFDEPLVGFLYQYFSGGNLVSAHTTSIMTTTITDVVTTW